MRFDIQYHYLMTAYFALFIFMDIFNAFNSRTERINILANIAKNKVFIFMFAFIITVQIYLIYHGGDVFRTYGLTIPEFILILLMAVTVIPVDWIRKKLFRRRYGKLNV